MARSTAQATKDANSRIVRHQVREGLQQMILSGQRQPGTKLRQQELAEHFGVAQGVVREALLELQAYGLVEIIDNRGVFVSRLDKSKLLEAFEVREMHEGLAARLCCQRATREEIHKLREMVEEIYRLDRQKRYEEMGVLDREFHMSLIDLSGNSMLVRLAHNYRILGKFVRANRNAQEVREEHQAILKAIENGQADQAEKLIREHVAAARRAVEDSLKDSKFQPQWII